MSLLDAAIRWLLVPVTPGFISRTMSLGGGRLNRQGRGGINAELGPHREDE